MLVITADTVQTYGHVIGFVTTTSVTKLDTVEKFQSHGLRLTFKWKKLLLQSLICHHEVISDQFNHDFRTSASVN